MVRVGSHRLLIAALAACAMAGGGIVAAQQGAAPAAAPVSASGSFEVGGVRVDVAGPNAEAARLAGWKLAERRAWTQLSRRLRGSEVALPEGAIDGLVSGIIIENEQIGPNRYIARLGVLFDRNRAAAILGVAARFARSAPLVLMPVEWSGGTGTVFERETEWTRAWARFRTSNSAIDYVRLTGTGPDPLLFDVGQIGRRGRGWWRTILDQYGADDVLIPQVHLYRQWPAGPVVGEFIAGFGPDNRILTRFTLRVDNADALPALLDEGVRRIDAAYQDALRRGRLRPDALLAVRPPSPENEVDPAAIEVDDLPVVSTVTTGGAIINVQFDSPSAGAVTGTESALAAVPGVRSALTSSLALGGISVMRVTYDGSIAALRTALEARGWQVQEGPGTLRIRRGASPAPAAPAAGAGDAPQNATNE